MNTQFREKIRNFRLPVWLCLPLAAVYDEAALHLWTQDALVPGRFAAVLAFGLAFGTLLALAVSFLPKRAGKWAAVAVSAVLAVLYLMEYFLDDAYQNFMPLSTVLAGAEGVATGFLSIVISQLLQNWWRIALMLLPAALFAVFAAEKKTGWKLRTALAAAGLGLYLLGFGIVNLVGTDAARFTSTYNFDSAVQAFGLNVSMALDLVRGDGEGEASFETVTLPTETTQPTEAATQPAEQETTEPETTAETEPPVIEYGVNALALDFAALAETETDSGVASIHSYVASLTPASRNAYTGMFAGKNLIFITAEAFSAEVIDPELTPTLYRLATQGIEFTDYYQPAWGCSTTGGEFSNLLSLIPQDGSCMLEVTQQNMFLSLGNQLGRLGYATAAFHNNSYTYYKRNQTHPCLGYSLYMGYGNGMEEGVTGAWPQSDLEMVDYTLPMYLDAQPFHLYYMSVSGHSLYSRGGNDMSDKNYDAVADLPYSETVKCYLAANLELEYALASMVAQLEAAGIADDTVIVLATDHYPYGLEKSSAWGNDVDYLTELFGYSSSGNRNRDHSALILWSGCLEGLNIQVDTPVSSLDILPTLSNLFGLAYDSRLMLGRDVFSEEQPLVMWVDYSWKTEKGYYDADTCVFTPVDGVEVEEGYVDYINAIVANKFLFSKSVQKYNYFDILAEYLEE